MCIGKFYIGIFFLFAFLFGAKSVKADSVHFISQMLADTLSEKHAFPKNEAKRFSECVENYIKPKINEQQKAALDKAQWDLSEYKAISIATETDLQKSNFPSLGASAQQHCIEIFYPKP